MVLILLLPVLLAPGLFAQEAETPPEFFRPIYDTGDTVLNFGAGLLAPLFNSDIYGNIIPYGKQLAPGGIGFIEYDAYLNTHMRLGLQVAGMFARTINKNTLTMVPLTGKFTYLFDLYPVTIPVFLGAGFSFNKMGKLYEFPLILKPGVGVYWNMRGKWGFGGQLVYWWIPEIHFRELRTQTRFGNFLEVSLGAVYHP
jgi:hypothetical protein